MLYTKNLTLKFFGLEKVILSVSKSCLPMNFLDLFFGYNLACKVDSFFKNL